jgi:hypothetical protein
MKTTKYKVTAANGSIGYGTEWWTQEDWDKWNKTVERMKKDGTYGQLTTYDVELVHNPVYDTPRRSFPTIKTCRIDILDFSKK